MARLQGIKGAACFFFLPKLRGRLGGQTATIRAWVLCLHESEYPFNDNTVGQNQWIYVTVHLSCRTNLPEWRRLQERLCQQPRPHQLRFGGRRYRLCGVRVDLPGHLECDDPPRVLHSSHFSRIVCKLFVCVCCCLLLLFVDMYNVGRPTLVSASCT